MKVRIFTLRFNQLSGSFDDAEVRAFIADKEVQAIRDHAFVHQGVPHLVLVVTYHASGGSETIMPTGKNHANSQDESWRKVLTEADVPLFNTLREWRSAKAREEGVPTYFICTNKQLADIAHARPGSMTALGKVDGFGEGRLKKYGQAILAITGNPAGMNISYPAETNEINVPTPSAEVPPDETRQ